MIEPIVWPRQGPDEPESPFVNGLNRRPLRITLHTQTLSNLSSQDAEALQALKELANLPDIEILQTEPGDFPHIQIGELQYQDDQIPIFVELANGTRHYTSIWFAGQYRDIAAMTLKKSHEDKESRAFHDELIITRAHHALSQDILVTTSPRLIENRSGNSWLWDANPRTPLEAARVVGLLLRSRECYIISASRRHTKEVGNQGFYRVLAHYKLESLWRYISSSMELANKYGDDSLGLSKSVVIRCARALEARDKIGELFYNAQPHNMIEGILYHFDYISLLLAGAIDAQTRITYRVLKHQQKLSFGEFSAGFQNQYSKQTGKYTKTHDLVTALSTSLSSLHQVVTRANFQNVMVLLHGLRNTIHAVAVPTAISINIGDMASERHFMKIEKEKDESLFSTIFDAVSQIGSPEMWGVKHQNYNVALNSNSIAQMREELLIEPYTFVTVLIEECLNLINQIADATDFSGVLNGNPPPLFGKPKSGDRNYDLFIGDGVRIAVLG